MSWEERNGQRYYYRKKRIGKTVISEYVGTGWIAEEAAALDDVKRAHKRSERQIQRRLRAQFRKDESNLNRLQGDSRLLTRAVVLLAGYHPHKGQWRKRQDG